MDAGPIADLAAPLARLGLVRPGEAVDARPLTGGVASDIWLIHAGARSFVVKRALEKLRVTADWRAPIARNAAEAAWLETAADIIPESVPKLLAHDAQAGFFAMEFLPPERFPVWKAGLRDGVAAIDVARQVGRQLGRLHAATAGGKVRSSDFNPDATFHALRLEPYLLFTAGRHPSVTARLTALVETTLATKLALVHGDVSPKNILVGDAGPIFLDAECAWHGDPAFDLAFCLTHLMLKCVWNPAAAAGLYVPSFSRLVEAYLGEVDWEGAAALERRASGLLPAIVLARIDGKSPVEYISDETDKQHIRAFALPLIEQPAEQLAPILARWKRERGIP
jgi:aminoglycoside phosphotransferase (APT) family kinase protein